MDVEVVGEGMPVRLRSASVRIQNVQRARADGDVWLDAAIAPYLEVSAFNSDAFEQRTGRALVPGAATGIKMHGSLGPYTVGCEGFVGVNRAAELGRLSDVVDHVHWGGRFYIRLSI